MVQTSTSGDWLRALWFLVILGGMALAFGFFVFGVVTVDFALWHKVVFSALAIASGSIILLLLYVWVPVFLRF